MRNLELAAILGEIADLLEIKGENPYKVRAYRRGAQAVALLADDVRQLAAAGGLRRVDGIGEALEAKIREWAETGAIAYHQRLLQEIPRGLIDVTRVPGVGPKLAKRMFEQAGVESLDDLRRALRTGGLQGVAGLGPMAQARIARALEEMEVTAGRLPLAEALAVATHWLELLGASPGVAKVEVAGSLRRGKDHVGDVDIVVGAEAPQEVTAHVAALPGVKEVSTGAGAVSLRLPGGVRLDLCIVPLEAFASALVCWTGSRGHVERLRERAEALGYRLGEAGLEETASGHRLLPGSEEELYRTLGLAYVPPEIREDRGEVERAASGTLPRLVAAEDLRGDLHVHSTWSDGTASIAEIARAALEMGRAYVAICDHSRSLRIAGGLGPEELRRQEEEILAVQEQFPGIRILRGIEVDILSDGRLDLPDEVLERLDIVVASVHSGLNQDRDRITERIVRAIEHPCVDVIGHPTGRRIGRRPPCEIDFDAVLAAAARCGKALEINASPSRLDLPDELAARAIEAGIALAIDTDAHDLDELRWFPYGLRVARRAGAEPRCILNTRSVEELLAWRRDRRGA